MKTALITGINGQDGSYLAEFLLEKGYDVHGIVRRNSIPENQTARIQHIYDEVKNNIYHADVCDMSSLLSVIYDVEPDEIYNLAAQSHVRISFDMPSFTIQTNALGVLNMLEVYRTLVPEAKFYQHKVSKMVIYDILDR